MEAGLNTTTIDSIRDAGFKFIAFKDGKTSNIVQGLTQPRYGIFTFNTVDYLNWTTFKNESLQVAKIIAEFQNVYEVKAFSLMYIDEFYFEKGSDYNPNELFNLESRNLPKGLDDSDFVDFNFNLKRHHDGRDYFENVSIKVFNEGKQKTIRITENLTFEIRPMSFVDVLSKSNLEEYLDYSHEENKKTLKDILNPNVAKIINL